MWQQVALVIATALAVNSEIHHREGCRPSNAPGLWSAFDNALAEATYIDLTHTLTPKTPVSSGDVSPQSFLRATNVSAPGVPFTWEANGFAANAYELHTDQYGSQLDPPAHWNPIYPAIDELPPTFALRPLVVIDITDKVKKDFGYQLKVEDVLAWETKHKTNIPKGSVVFVRSDWSKQWDVLDPVELADQFPFPGQSLAAIQFLHLNRSILFHGHEPLDTDTTPTLESEAWLLQNGYTQAEGVNNLHKVAEIGCLVSSSVPKLRGGLGGFARYVAICPKQWRHGYRIDQTPDSPLPKQPSPLVYNPDEGYLRSEYKPIPESKPVQGEKSATDLKLWDIFSQKIRTAKHIDLTHTMTTKTPVWAGFTTPPAKIAFAVNSTSGKPYTWENDGFAGLSYRFETDQFGTQLDPPAHWNPDYPAIDELPPTFAVRPLVIIDITAKVKTDDGYQLAVDDILAWENKHQITIPKGAVVFVRSDWSKQWDVVDPVQLAASFPFPGQTLASVKFLHLNRSILFHGHEPLDTDTTPTLESEAWLLQSGYTQAEGVGNMDGVPEVGCLVQMGFPKLRGGLGGYARYIAICPEDAAIGVTINAAAESPLPKQKSPLQFVDGQGLLRT
ncbi:cyclase [Thraustotheca clavata]|uniref:Cyclase n=1 Tax=Thraustotheca clavata TaxID=74557 RepID=A0A1V9Z3J2_9STRA|nr:cyclase [Thraustotheca clavata]